MLSDQSNKTQSVDKHENSTGRLYLKVIKLSIALSILLFGLFFLMFYLEFAIMLFIIKPIYVAVIIQLVIGFIGLFIRGARQLGFVAMGSAIIVYFMFFNAIFGIPIR